MSRSGTLHLRIPRLADLREPPIVGRFYMVPVTKAIGYCGIDGDLPVLGPAHTDAEHFNFAHRHYHVDARFLTDRERRKISSHYVENDVFVTAGALPLTNLYSGGIEPGRPRLARRRCWSAQSPYKHGGKAPVEALRADLGEPDAIMLADGRMLCPHRKVDLSQFEPDADGLVTCPLHGLRVRCTHPLTISKKAA